MLNELLRFLTKDPTLSNALATVASAILAGAAVVISVVSLFVAHATLRHHRRHNVLSVKPIPAVTVADHEKSVRIKIRNHGSGPLIVKDLHVTDGSGTKESLIDWMPDLPDQLLWTDFAGPIKNRSVLPGSEIVLLEFTGDSTDRAFTKARDRVRSVLSRLTVVIQYTDIYDSRFDPHAHDLSWFGR